MIPSARTGENSPLWFFARRKTGQHLPVMTQIIDRALSHLSVAEITAPSEGNRLKIGEFSEKLPTSNASVAG